MKSCVTISLVPEAKGGPFVFWDDLPASIKRADDLGYDAVEIFAPEASALGRLDLQRKLGRLKVAAFGTGAGWLKHRLTLTMPDAGGRQVAKSFIREFIDFAADFSAAVIIGSMQGRHEGEVSRDQALQWLAEGLRELGEYAAGKRVRIFYEPLNRYETNLLNRMDDVLPFIQSIACPNVQVLADLFHMNIEEADIPGAIRKGRGVIGHIHFVDSNRRSAGLGHTNFAPICQALQEIEYEGYLSAEAFPYPDSESAATQTLKAFRSLLRS